MNRGHYCGVSTERWLTILSHDQVSHCPYPIKQISLCSRGPMSDLPMAASNPARDLLCFFSLFFLLSLSATRSNRQKRLVERRGAQICATPGAESSARTGREKGGRAQFLRCTHGATSGWRAPLTRHQRI